MAVDENVRLAVVEAQLKAHTDQCVERHEENKEKLRGIDSKIDGLRRWLISILGAILVSALTFAGSVVWDQVQFNRSLVVERSGQ